MSCPWDECMTTAGNSEVCHHEGCRACVSAATRLSCRLWKALPTSTPSRDCLLNITVAPSWSAGGSVGPNNCMTGWKALVLHHPSLFKTFARSLSCASNLSASPSVIGWKQAVRHWRQAVLVWRCVLNLARQWYHFMQTLQTASVAKYLATFLYPWHLCECMARPRLEVKADEHWSQCHKSVGVTSAAIGRSTPCASMSCSNLACHVSCLAMACL